MAKYNCEVIGVLQYSPDMGYHELYEMEERRIDEIHAILEHAGAEHIDFWGTGDALQLQCELQEYDEHALASLSDEIAAVLSDDVAGKMCCVDKSLSGLSLFFLAPGRWRREGLDLADTHYQG
jgi:hypothetical protein